MELGHLDDIKLDALREVSNIGAGHAATALSELVGQKVIINIPDVRLYPLEDILQEVAGPEEKLLGVQIELAGPINGKALLLFTEAESRNFAACILGRHPSEINSWDAEAESALKESANILTCAYLNAIGEMMDFVVIPSTPILVSGSPKAILSLMMSQGRTAEDLTISINNEFKFLDRRSIFKGFYLLLSDIQSLSNIFKALHLI